MSSCPSLEVLDVWTISGTDMVQIAQIQQDDGEEFETIENIVFAEDWVCLGLKTLSVIFELSSRRQDVEASNSADARKLERQRRLEQDYVFQQLSRLTRLEKLDISCQSEPVPSVDLRMESRGGGLNKLASLNRLELFHFYRTDQKLSKEEIDWMLKHWPKLRYSIGHSIVIFNDAAKKTN
ncbi:hypothetical protein BGX26_009685 [Mortierella sp. AD094]|nr:hypothetical protein BGX26_009685 [Mortierella sp. AD094]